MPLFSKFEFGIAADRSPFDGDWLYWSQRLGKHPELSTRVAALLKRQSGKCPSCGLYFKAEDQMEIDHVLPRSQGGNTSMPICNCCIDTVTTTKRAAIWSGMPCQGIALLRS